ncbi:hypothetical protein F383_14130 [Gossypium arboreum]|uniref:Uncharacterized protein n=1 Tax=Gossypium arboreum TaxID=29729 RepID=A0A0B0PM36_GOSAR|nr:hypothetical protein F383_14130 [Gossypium arboreum]
MSHGVSLWHDRSTTYMGRLHACVPLPSPSITLFEKGQF